MNSIYLKKFVDEAEITLEKVSQQTGISISMLTTMYYDGLFDSTKIDVNQLTTLIQVLNIINITDLIPSVE